MSQDLVSIVIPCYRGARYLPEAIESCLRQTHRELEVIVVDDASPDDCAAIAERYARSDDRVRPIRRPENGGVSRAMNTGLGAARGDYLTRLAQDDVFGECALEVMVRHLRERPEVGLVYCDYHSINDRGEVVKRVCVPGPAEVLSFRNRIGLCVLWRRAVWEQLGGFDPRFDTAEDFEYWLRIARSFPLAKCPGVAPFYVRVHDAMGSVRYFERQECATLQVLHRSYPGGGPLRQRLRRRKAFAHIWYSSSTDYSATGRRHAAALARVFRSLMLWPFPYRSGELSPPLARLRAVVVYAMRLAQLRS